MKTRHSFQQKIVKSMEQQFYDMILIPSNGFDDTYLKLELQNLMETIHHNILQYYFEDELLLRLLEIHGYATSYLQGIKPTEISYRLSV